MFSFVQVVAVIIIALFSEAESNAVCETEACNKTAERILYYMDPSVRPCDDFYKFACGRILDTTETRAFKFQTQTSSLMETGFKLNEQLKTIVFENSCIGDPLPYHNVKLLFSLCMNEDKMDARGVGHALTLLQKAGGWPVLGDWRYKGWNFLDTAILLNHLGIGADTPFGVSFSPDLKNNSRFVLEIDQPTFGLDREFLIKGMDDPIVQAYYSYMVDIAVMFGADRETAKDQLKQSLLFEIELAKISIPREERRNMERMYNMYELTELMAEIDWIDWAWVLSSIMLKPMILTKNELINVKEVGFLKKLEKLVHNHPPKVIANHMMWHVARNLLKYLTNEMRNRRFKFIKAVRGSKYRNPRFMECIEDISSLLPHALSSMYIKKFFDETMKKEALDMTENIRLEMIRSIRELDWMDEKTRERAQVKASKIVEHIGYPDELIDLRKLEDFYKGMILNKELYFESVINIWKWNTAYKLLRLRDPVNKTDWRDHSDITTVNAFYSFNENSIQFPAGILQKTIFNAQVPKYFNYGSIGLIVGHEITHGFDDKGSQFDYKGDLKDWWEERSKVNFIKEKQCIIDQCSGFKEDKTKLNLNGITTQGENVADNGGLKLAYRAYQRLAKQLDEPEPLLPGLQKFNQNQLFFLSMARMWCQKISPETLMHMITTDEHSPPEFRVNGVLKNFPQFSEVFHCSANDPMNPRKKCAVW